MANVLDAALVEALRREEHTGLSEVEPFRNGLRSKRREQRTEHGPMLERAQSRDVELRNPPCERVNPIAGFDTERREHVREASTERIELRICERPAPALLPEPSDRGLIAVPMLHVPPERFIRNVDSTPARKAIELRPHRIPRKRRTFLVVVFHVGSDLRVDLAGFSHGGVSQGTVASSEVLASMPGACMHLARQRGPQRSAHTTLGISEGQRAREAPIVRITTPLAKKLRRLRSRYLEFTRDPSGTVAALRVLPRTPQGGDHERRRSQQETQAGPGGHPQ